VQPCSEQKGRLRASLAQTASVSLISKSQPVCVSVWRAIRGADLYIEITNSFVIIMYTSVREKMRRMGLMLASSSAASSALARRAA
jgi:hypothetical protein